MGYVFHVKQAGHRRCLPRQPESTAMSSPNAKPNAQPTRSATRLSAGPADLKQAEISRLIDFGLLFACLTSIATFITVLMSPALANVRRTYMELGTLGRLGCASLFMAGMLMLLLSLFWMFVYGTIAWRMRGSRVRRETHTALKEGFGRAQRDAAALNQNLLADLRQHGATDQEMAQVRALIDSVSRKVALQSQRQIADYENNPAALAQDIRASAERLERGEALEGAFRRAA